MADRGWKSYERRCARDMGVQRIPSTGARAGADAETEMFCFQFKLGRRMPSYLREWLSGIRAAGTARRPEKIGLVVWKPLHARDEDAVVVLAWRDWVALHGTVAPAEGGGDG